MRMTRDEWFLRFGGSTILENTPDNLINLLSKDDRLSLVVYVWSESIGFAQRRNTLRVPAGRKFCLACIWMFRVLPAREAIYRVLDSCLWRVCVSAQPELLSVQALLP